MVQPGTYIADDEVGTKPGEDVRKIIDMAGDLFVKVSWEAEVVNRFVLWKARFEVKFIVTIEQRTQKRLHPTTGLGVPLFLLT